MPFPLAAKARKKAASVSPRRRGWSATQYTYRSAPSASRVPWTSEAVTVSYTHLDVYKRQNKLSRLRL